MKYRTAVGALAARQTKRYIGIGRLAEIHCPARRCLGSYLSPRQFHRSIQPTIPLFIGNGVQFPLDAADRGVPTDALETAKKLLVVLQCLPFDDLTTQRFFPNKTDHFRRLHSVWTDVETTLTRQTVPNFWYGE